MNDDPQQQFTLAQIQDTYFDFLGLHFGEIHQMMVARKLTPHDVATGVSAAPEAVEPFIKFIPEFLQALGEFWSHMGATAIAQAEQMSILENNSKTPVLPDLFLRSMTSLTQGPDDKRVYALVLRAMETLQSRLDKPNLVVLPAPTDLSP